MLFWISIISLVYVVNKLYEKEEQRKQEKKWEELGITDETC